MIFAEFRVRQDEILNDEYFKFSLNSDLAFKFIKTFSGEFHVTDEFEKEASCPFSD